MKIYTENSTYEFDTEKKLCRRIPSPIAGAMPKDEEWLHYLSLRYEVGEEMRIVTEHIGGEKGSVTLRTTSTVVRVEE